MLKLLGEQIAHVQAQDAQQQFGQCGSCWHFRQAHPTSLRNMIATIVRALCSDALIVVAPIGEAALNVDGQTSHEALSNPPARPSATLLELLIVVQPLFRHRMNKVPNSPVVRILRIILHPFLRHTMIGPCTCQQNEVLVGYIFPDVFCAWSYCTIYFSTYISAFTVSLHQVILFKSVSTSALNQVCSHSDLSQSNNGTQFKWK